MKFAFPIYLHGMLRTTDKRFVFGDLKPIAYSAGFSDQLQREVYNKIKPGLSPELLRETGMAYGFFHLSNDDFIVARYKLMYLTEPTSRGNPVFSEYLYVTASQLADLEWNLLPIFQAPSIIDYYDQVVTDLAPVEIDYDQQTEWFEILRQFPVHVEAVLVRYLASTNKVNIISATDDSQLRLKFLCALVHCMPDEYKKSFSFATLASETSETVRIFFSFQQSGYGQIVDWATPTVPSMPGAVYANWVAGLISKGNVQCLMNEISGLLLPLPGKSEHLNTYGEELDISIRNKEWYNSREEHLRIMVTEQLSQLFNQINEFSCLYSDQQVAKWLSVILTFVMKLSAYDIGVKVLSIYSSLLTSKDIRQQLVQKIIQETLLRNEDNISALANLIVQITQHAITTNQNVLIEFCKEILILCLSLGSHLNGLTLWARLNRLSWVNSVEWFCMALTAIPSIQSVGDFIYIVNDIGCPADKKAFVSLLALLQKSPNVMSQLPECARFLDTSKNYCAKECFDNALECFLKVGSHQWLSTQFRYIDGIYPNDPTLIPSLLNKISINKGEKLLNQVAISTDSRQTVLIGFSLISNGIYPNNSISSTLFDKCINICKDCKSEDIEHGLAILSNRWKYLSIDQLESMLGLLEQKKGNFSDIAQNIRVIKGVIQQKENIQRVINLFRQKKDATHLSWIIQEFIPEFALSADVDAWNLFVKNIIKNGYLQKYQGFLVDILLNSQGFYLRRDQMRALIPALEHKGLQYEADIFMYWLIFIGDSSISPIQVLIRTLNFNSVPPIYAGAIIGYDRSLNKNYALSLAKKLMREDSLNTRTLMERLDEYVSNHPVSSVQTRIKSLLWEVDSNVIWVEFCKTLSRYIKSEIHKTSNRRK